MNYSAILRKLRAAFAGLCWASALPATAGLAYGDPDLPTAPFVAPAPNPSQWKITIIYDEDGEPGSSTSTTQASRVKEIQEAKSGKIRREICIWGNGTQSENWYLGNVFVEHQPTWPEGHMNAQYIGDRPNDGFQLEWVGLPYFKGKESMQGHDCYVYEVPESNVRPGMGPSKELAAKANDSTLPPGLREMYKQQVAEAQKLTTSTVKAWIDQRTRLPVQIYGDGIKKQFEFSLTAPVLQVPPAYLAQVDLLKKMYPNAFKSTP